VSPITLRAVTEARTSFSGGVVAAAALSGAFPPIEISIIVAAEFTASGHRKGVPCSRTSKRPTYTYALVMVMRVARATYVADEK